MLHRSCAALGKKASTAPFTGNIFRQGPNEFKLRERLAADDAFRASTGQPVWMNSTKKQLQEMRGEEGMMPLIDEYVSKPSAYERSLGRVDMKGLDAEGLSPSVCRMLLRQGVTSLTDIQKQMMRAMNEQATDIVLTSYTGCGKTFGLCLLLADRMLTSGTASPFGFIAIAPSLSLCLQIHKWVTLFTSASQVVVVDPTVSPTDNLCAVRERQPALVIATLGALTEMFKAERFERQAERRRRRAEVLRTGTQAERRVLPTVAQQLMEMSRMIVVDEVDSVLPIEECDPQHYGAREALRRLIRVGGGTGQRGKNAVPAQQLVFVSATVNSSAYTGLLPLMRSSVLHRPNESPYANNSDIQGKRGLGPSPSLTHGHRKTNEPLVVRAFETTGDSKKSNLKNLDTFTGVNAVVQHAGMNHITFPATLSHAFVLVDDTREIAAAIRRILGSYRSQGTRVGVLHSWSSGGKKHNQRAAEESQPRADERELFARTFLRAGQEESPAAAKQARCLVFCEQAQVDGMVECLRRGVGVAAEAYRGRERQLSAARLGFENGELAALVVPNDTVRGLDLQGVTHVFILGVPDTLGDYTHLSGRAARNGEEGLCVTLLHTKQLRQLREMLQGAVGRLAPVKLSAVAAVLPDPLETGAQRIKKKKGEGAGAAAATTAC